MKESKKGYTIKPTKEQLKMIKESWKQFCEIQDKFYRKIKLLEAHLGEETGIKGIEFFCSDGDWCGVGNADRSMKLIHLDPV